jgi:hypothetical protein
MNFHFTSDGGRRKIQKHWRQCTLESKVLDLVTSKIQNAWQNVNLRSNDNIRFSLSLYGIRRRFKLKTPCALACLFWILVWFNGMRKYAVTKPIECPYFSSFLLRLSYATFIQFHLMTLSNLFLTLQPIFMYADETLSCMYVFREITSSVLIFVIGHCF